LTAVSVAIIEYDLRIGQPVRGLNSDKTLSQRLGAAETFPELQLGLTRAEDQKGLGLPQLTDDLVVVPVQMLAVAFLVFFLAPAILRARITSVLSDVGFQGLGGDAIR